MKTIINGKRYDSSTAIKIAEKKHYNNGYSGTTYIMVSPKGNLFAYTHSNGQDLYLENNVTLDFDIDGYDIIDEELAKKYKLIEEA
jgi:hypothetical protein